MDETQSSPHWGAGKIIGVTVLLLLWFGTAYGVGVGQLLVNDRQSLVAPIALSVVVPVVGFLALYGLWWPFREFVLSQDIRTLTMLQHWRVLGFGFLTLYFYDVLPGLFAWPAGLGDVAIGLAAPFVVARLARDPDYAASSGLVRFHLLGLLDFVVAVTTAGLAAGAFPALIPAGINTAPMDVWPLNLFPSFFVPMFIILHLSVLFKVRQIRRASEPRLAPVAGPAQQWER